MAVRENREYRHEKGGLRVEHSAVCKNTREERTEEKNIKTTPSGSSRRGIRRFSLLEVVIDKQTMSVMSPCGVRRSACMKGLILKHYS